MGWIFKDKPEEVSEQSNYEALGVGLTTFGSSYTSRTVQHLKDASTSQPTSASSARANTTYLTSDIVHKCAEYIAKNVSQVRFDAMQRDKKTGQLVPIKDKKLKSLFSTYPNEYQTWTDLLYIDTLAQLLTGNSYLTFEKVSGKYEMWAITFPQEMQVTTDGNGLIDGYVFNGKIDYTRDEIIHNKNNILGNGYYGASVLESLTDTLTMEGYATQDLIKFYENGTISTSVLSSEHPLTKKQAEELSVDLNKKYSMTSGKRHSMIVLPNNLSVKPLRLSPKEAMMLESLDITEDRILSAFHLHKMVLGGEVESYTHSIDSLVQMQFTNAIRPIIYRIRDNLEAFFRRTLRSEDIVIVPNYDNLPEVSTAKLVHFDKARTLYTSGLATLNEARQVLGLPPIENDYANKNFVPEYLIGSNYMTVQELNDAMINDLREQTKIQDKQMSTDALGGANDKKGDK